MSAISGNNKQRNTYVKTKITKALLVLMEETEWNHISIKELCERAGVGRVSFYRNFTDLKDVLKQESDRLIAASGSLKTRDNDPSYFAFFDFLNEHKTFYSAIFRCGQNEILLDSLLKLTEITDEMPEMEAYLKSFWAYGLYGWICEWIRRGMDTSSQAMFSMLNQMRQQAV